LIAFSNPDFRLSQSIARRGIVGVFKERRTADEGFNY
jgi:hypothetical protein